MTRRKIFLHGLAWVDVKPNVDSNQKFDVKPNIPKEEKLTKDRKIKLDKMIKGSGFKKV